MSSAEDLTAAPRFRVGVVGSGRVGAVLGAALDRAGHTVVAVSAVSEESVERAHRMLPEARVCDVTEVVEHTDLVLLAVPDEALPGLVRGLAAVGAFHAGQVVAHTSGRYGVGVFDSAAPAEILPLALHPAMSFTGREPDLDRLKDACIAVTTTRELQPLGEALVLEMGAEPVWVEEEDRALYHAGVTLAAAHLPTLVTQSEQLLEDAGVAEPRRILAALLTTALDNALREGDHALSGPTVLGDADTVAEHLAELASEPQIRSTYKALVRATVEFAASRGRLRSADADSLRAVLRDRDDPDPQPPDSDGTDPQADPDTE